MWISSSFLKSIVPQVGDDSHHTSVFTQKKKIKKKVALSQSVNRHYQTSLCPNCRCPKKGSVLLFLLCFIAHMLAITMCELILSNKLCGTGPVQFLCEILEKTRRALETIKHCLLWDCSLFEWFTCRLAVRLDHWACIQPSTLRCNSLWGKTQAPQLLLPHEAKPKHQGIPDTVSPGGPGIQGSVLSETESSPAHCHR